MANQSKITLNTQLLSDISSLPASDMHKKLKG